VMWSSWVAPRADQFDVAGGEVTFKSFVSNKSFVFGGDLMHDSGSN
jgi:hypothetical protein